MDMRRRAVIGIPILMTFVVGLEGQESEPGNIAGQPAEEAPSIPQRDEGPRYDVSGIVVNSVSGEPVPRALVRLDSRIQRMALTDGDGHFEFHNVVRDTATVSAQKPGFFSPAEVSGPLSTSYPVFQVGPGTGSLRVPLIPAANIAGRVTNEAGEPIEGMQVRAFFRHVLQGEARIEQRGDATTDDTGAFRLQNLIPGEYYVATLSRPVKVLAGSEHSNGRNYDATYPGIYYSGAAERSSATPLRVAPGQQLEIDFAENVQRGFQITGTVNGAPAERIVVALLDQDGAEIMTGPWLKPRLNQFRLAPVLPGQYTVLATSSNEKNQMLYGSAPVAIGATNLEGISIDLSPAVRIPVEVESDSPSSDPNQLVVQVHLLPVTGTAWNNDYWSRQDVQDGRPVQVVENVMPGRYRVEAQQNSGSYISAIRNGTADLMRGELVIVPGAQPPAIELSLRNAGATLNGTLLGTQEDKSVSVLVIPDEASALMPQVFEINGGFAVRGLAPGSYHIYAFSSLDGVEYRKPEAMHKYDNYAVAVSLTENETKQIELHLIAGDQL